MKKVKLDKKVLIGFIGILTFIVINVCWWAGANALSVGKMLSSSVEQEKIWRHDDYFECVIDEKAPSDGHAIPVYCMNKNNKSEKFVFDNTQEVKYPNFKTDYFWSKLNNVVFVAVNRTEGYVNDDVWLQFDSEKSSNIKSLEYEFVYEVKANNTDKYISWENSIEFKQEDDKTSQKLTGKIPEDITDHYTWRYTLREYLDQHCINKNLFDAIRAGELSISLIRVSVRNGDIVYNDKKGNGKSDYYLDFKLSSENYIETKGISTDDVYGDGCFSDALGLTKDPIRGDGIIYIFSDRDGHYDIRHLSMQVQSQNNKNEYEVCVSYFTDTWDLDLDGEKFKIEGSIFMDGKKIATISGKWRDKQDDESFSLTDLDGADVWHINKDEFSKKYGCSLQKAIKDGRCVVELNHLYCCTD